MKKCLLLLTSCLMLVSCIEEYNISSRSLTEENSTIVIQGRVLAGGESVIYISKTVPIGSDEQPAPIENATVFIVDKNGTKSENATYNAEEGCYTIDTNHLDNDNTYALNVEYNGEHYASEFLTLQKTPEIDSVTYKEREDGVSIRISTHNTNASSKYYMWSYEEDWEFHATYDLREMKGIPNYDRKFYNFDMLMYGQNPYLYCWKHQNSSNIHIYATDNLQENTVKDIELIRIPKTDIRISYIYSILVKQYSLSKEAYNYYKMLELYTEESAGLFTPMPNELTGNVRCISNPEIKALGYVLGSNVTTKRLFIYESDFETFRSEYEDEECGLLYPEPDNQHWPSSWFELIKNSGAVAMTKYGDYHPYNNPFYLESVLYYRECVDCRALKGATKKRPDFWPNNHE